MCLLTRRGVGAQPLDWINGGLGGRLCVSPASRHLILVPILGTTADGCEKHLRRPGRTVCPLRASQSGIGRVRIDQRSRARISMRQYMAEDARIEALRAMIARRIASKLPAVAIRPSEPRRKSSAHGMRPAAIDLPVPAAFGFESMRRCHPSNSGVDQQPALCSRRRSSDIKALRLSSAGHSALRVCTRPWPRVVSRMRHPKRHGIYYLASPRWAWNANA